MKQLLILSGKGGTGKTTIAGAFIKLANAKVYADCDVDAPNLHLVMKHASQPKRKDFYGMDKAEINPDLCTECDLCRQHCRFDAILLQPNYKVDEYACEGCGVCEVICSKRAITLKHTKAGELLLYKGKDSVFSTAQLKMGSGNSGLLVTEVKKQLKEVSSETNIAIIDGSPGIGCPVIASLSGVDMVLVVTEPTLSGISDLDRLIQTAEGFHMKIGVCINKYDIDTENTEKIKALCQEYNIPIMGEIPFDNKVVKAINAGISIVDIDCISGNAAKEVFDRTTDYLFSGVSK